MNRVRLAVLVAAGEGRRLGRPEGKALAPLGGRPLFLHSLLTLAQLDGLRAAAVVVREKDKAAVDRIIGALPPLIAARCGPECLVVVGGASRQGSVRAGLEALAAEGWAGATRRLAVVLIHDAARPLVPLELAEAVATAAADAPGAVVSAAATVVDTLRYEEPNAARVASSAATPSRDGLYSVQTPQAGHFEELLAAHRLAVAANQEDAHPDDLAVGQAAGLQVVLVPGDRRNLKMTHDDDLAMAEALLKGRLLPRSGIGLDVHAFGPARNEAGSLRLGGVSIPHSLGLLGHSDADVAVHAVIDALLGAAGSGDIGLWFLPGDPKWRGADSLGMLTRLWTRLTASGLLLGNIDLTIAAEEPRLAPHYVTMRRALAGALGSELADINVKATTTERLGFVGSGQGIAALATATVFAPPGWQPLKAGELD